MQTSWPWVQPTNHKATMSPQEKRVYTESFLKRNKFYKTEVKFSSLIFFFFYKTCISSRSTDIHIRIDGYYHRKNSETFTLRCADVSWNGFQCCRGTDWLSSCTKSFNKFRVTRKSIALEFKIAWNTCTV